MLDAIHYLNDIKFKDNLKKKDYQIYYLLRANVYKYFSYLLKKGLNTF